MYLSLVDPRFASEVIEINTDAASAAQPLSFALRPVRTVTGRVTYADTGRPVPQARVTVYGIGYRNGVRVPQIPTVADAEGRFRVNLGVSVNLSASPPDGQPYLDATKSVVVPKGAITHSIDFALPRGVMMRGKVTEKGSGRPISAAIATFHPRRTANERSSPPTSRPVETMADGRFQAHKRGNSGQMFPPAAVDRAGAATVAVSAAGWAAGRDEGDRGGDCRR